MVMGIARRNLKHLVLKWNDNASIWESFADFPPGEEDTPKGFCQEETSVFHEIWVITKTNRIFQYRYPLSIKSSNRSLTRRDWKEIPGPRSQITDITASGNGSVFISSKGSLYEWNRRSYSWKRYSIPKTALKIDAQYRIDIAQVEIIMALEDGSTAILQPSGKSDQFRWIPLGGSVYDVGVASASDSSRLIWSTSFDQRRTSWGGFVYLLDQMKSDTWQWVYPGAGCRITIDAKRSPWIINNEGKSFMGILLDKQHPGNTPNH